MVAEIIRLDNDDKAYLQKLETPLWAYGNSFEEYRQKSRLIVESCMDVLEYINTSENIFKSLVSTYSN